MPLAAALLAFVQQPQTHLPAAATLHQTAGVVQPIDPSRTRELSVTARTNFQIDRGALDRAVLRGQDVQLRVPLSQLGMREIEAGELTAAGWKDAANRVATSGDEALLSVPKGGTLVLRPKTVESLKLGLDRTYCAGKLLQATGATAADGTPVVRQFALFLSTRTSPLAWNDAAQAYATRLVVGVEDADEPALAAPLPQPITVQFFLDGRGLEVDPTHVEVVKSGTGGYVEAALLCRAHDVADAAVRARGSFGEQRWTFDVEPMLGALSVDVSPSTILGFGLESASLVVRRLAEDGREWAPPTPLSVTLEAEHGRLPALLEIPADASFARAELRSASVGLVKVGASAEGRRSDPAPVLFAWPVALLVTTLLFGALGGFVRAVQDERRRAKAKRSGGRVAFRAIAGAFTALVVVAAAIVGLAQFGPADVARSEAGAAVLAALAGWVGTLALGSLAKKLGIDPGEAKEPKPAG